MTDKTDPRRYRCCSHCQPSPNGGCGDMWGEPKDSHEVACPHGCNESLPAAGGVGVTTNTAAGYCGDSAMPNKAGGDQ